MLEVEKIALDITEEVERVVAAIRIHRPSLAEQADGAAESMGLNIAEALGRFAKDRTHQVTIAYGSARELRMALRIAQRRKYIGEEPELMAMIERELGLLFGLHRKLAAGQFRAGTSAGASAARPWPARGR